MVDENFDRLYREGRGELNAGIDLALRRIARSASAGFEALNRIQWSAPWAASNPTKCN